MSKKYEYDYIIIGSGPAGLAAATTLAKTRKKIAIIENDYYGGANANTRDIPYNVSLDFSHSYHKISNFPEFYHQDLHFNYPTVMTRQIKIAEKISNEQKAALDIARVTRIEGFANFLDNHTVAINEQKHTADTFIIATGAQPKPSGITGTDYVKYFTPETALQTRCLPEAVAVVGAGASGCEIAEFFAELGVKTLLFETSERILPREDAEVGKVLTEYFTQQLNISVLPSCRVVAIEKDNFSKRVIFRQNNSEKLVRVDTIVLATGSMPMLDIGLENANVNYKKSGIVVNKHFTTSAKNIYAIGDCIGGESSTDRAYMEGSLLAANLANKTKNTLNYNGVIRSVNTMPQIASVGLTEEDLLRRDRKYKKAFINLDEITASKIYNFNYGFIKLLADKNNHIIGCTIVAPKAELLISELAMAVRHNLTALELASTPHSINSFNYIIKLAAKQLLNKK